MRMPVRPLRHVRAIAQTWRSLEQHLEPEDNGLEPEAARLMHPIRAIALTRCPLECPEAKETQHEPKWTIHGCEATKEIIEVLRMPMRPLRHVRAIAPMWRPLERLLEPEDSGLELEGSGKHAVEAPHH